MTGRKRQAFTRTRRVLDLCCKAGGAGMGYHLAGFDEVVGVDIEPQPNYPFEFVQADALTFPLDGFDLIHVSPVCKGYSACAVLNDVEHPKQIDAFRQRLAASGIPYVIENVEGAPLIDPVVLCGAMFGGLRTYRHRLFESSIPVPQPDEPLHLWPLAKMGRVPGPAEFMHVVGHFSGVSQAREAMGIDWMTRDELAQAIPPAYTKYVGTAALMAIRGY